MARILARFTKAIAKAGAIVAFATSMAPAQAAIIYFYYGSDVVATVTTSNSTIFTMSFDYAPAAPGVAKINDLFMTYGATPTGVFSNLSGDTAPDATACSSLGSCPGLNSVSGANWKISWPVSGNTFDEGETSIFQIVTSDSSLWNLRELHINAFLNGNSIKLTGCLKDDPTCTPGICVPGTPGCNTVPEPGTLALLGAGIAGLALIRRRRRA